jgi:hypothetical protein
MDSDYRWRFVNAQAASGGNVYPCLVGRCAEKDNIRAMCMMINDTEVPNGSVVPTFRQQKTPDGRGWFVSAVASARISRKMRLYARASYVGYHFMLHEKRKPGKAELKLQVVFKL